jgi:photosystem II stability/assembly factor-like uncharacterized protein
MRNSYPTILLLTGSLFFLGTVNGQKTKSNTSSKTGSSQNSAATANAATNGSSAASNKTAIALVIPFEKAMDEAMKKIPKRNLGPGAMSGRITALAVPQSSPENKTHSKTIYAGAASGGVWKSVDGGMRWQPIFDDQDVQSIGAIAVDPNNPDLVWVGTGEGNPRNSHNSGKGIYRSLDGGKTWTCMGLEQTKTIHRIVVNPQNSQQIFVAAMGSVWGPNPERGVYRSDDGGKNWKLILAGSNNTTGCAELVMDPQNPLKLFANLYDFERKPWTFRSGGPGSGLYVTFDGGNSWKKLNSKQGLPEGDLGRIGIAIPRNNPRRVYALVEAKKSGFYRSDDGGANWVRVSDDENAGNRPFYYHEIYADPENENRVYSIWSQVSVSEDAGEHWKILADWGTIHPDHHAFLIHPRNSQYIINGNDGGLNISYDGGNSWRYAENIPVGQFYHIDVDNEKPYNIYGGLQDNGSWVGPAYHFRHGGIKNFEWQEVLFGDGFDVAPIPGQPGKGYAMWQGGNVYRFDLKARTNEPVKPQHPDGTLLRFNWNAAMLVDPVQPNGLYFGSQFLHYSPDQGNTWTILSGDLTTNNPQKLKQAESGGLSVDATGAENHCTILAIAAQGSDVIWVGTDDGNIQLTRDRGKNWTNLTSKIAGMPAGAWVPYLWVNPKNGGECWAVVNNYRQNDWKSYVFVTKDFGATWTNVASSLDMGYVHSVLPHPNTPNLVFLGSDRGLFVSVNGAKTWTRWKHGFPAVPVADMKIHARENDLILGTFGRGAWVFDGIGVLEKLATDYAQGVKLDKKPIQIAGSIDGHLAKYMSNSGTHFGAQTEFEAPNKSQAVMVDLWVNTSAKLNLVGKVYNEQGKLIRTHHFGFDSTGLYRFPWRMIQDGVRFPQYGKINVKDDLPPGVEVQPGRYKLVISGPSDSALFSDSVWVNVSGDAKSAAWMSAVDSLMKVVNRSTNDFERLKMMERNLSKWEQLEFAGGSGSTGAANGLSGNSGGPGGAGVSVKSVDSIQANFRKLVRATKDSVAQLKLLFMLPEGYRFYEDVTLRLNEVLYNAWGMVAGAEVLNENGKVAMLNAVRESNKVRNRIDKVVNAEYAKCLEILQREKDRLQFWEELK